MMVVASGVILPTVLMRDLSVLSYLSVFGIFAVRAEIATRNTPEHHACLKRCGLGTGADAALSFVCQSWAWRSRASPRSWMMGPA